METIKQYVESGKRGVLNIGYNRYNWHFLIIRLNNKSYHVLCPVCLESKVKWTNWGESKYLDTQLTATCDKCKNEVNDEDLIIGGKFDLREGDGVTKLMIKDSGEMKFV